jgi:diguanylate cyclase (GGDEF)-like protein/PAS domain S-box-containing protein
MIPSVKGRRNLAVPFVLVALAVGAMVAGANSTPRTAPVLAVAVIAAGIAIIVVPLYRATIPIRWRLLAIASIAFVAVDSYRVTHRSEAASGATLGVTGLALFGALAALVGLFAVARAGEPRWRPAVAADVAIVTLAFVTVGWERVAVVGQHGSDLGGGFVPAQYATAVLLCAAAATALTFSSRANRTFIVLAVALAARGLATLVSTSNEQPILLALLISTDLSLMVAFIDLSRRTTVWQPADPTNRTRVLSIGALATAAVSIAMLQAETQHAQLAFVPAGALVAVVLLLALRMWWLAADARSGAMRHVTRRLAAVVERLADGVFLVDARGRVIYATPTAARMVDLSGDAILGSTFVEHFAAPEGARVATTLQRVAKLSPTEAHEFAVTYQDRDGHECEYEVSCANQLRDRDVGAIVVTMRDVTTNREISRELERRAFHDELTQLSNRALVLDRLNHAIKRCSRSGNAIGVMMLDLDNFKDVNDALGHAAGDELLCAIARRLQTCVRTQDTIARLGGDEFAILLEDLPGPEGACETAQRILEVLQLPVPVKDLSIAVRASIGIAVSAQGGPAHLLKNADIALYDAKEQGKGCYVLYDETMGWHAYAKLQLRTELEAAIDNGELRIAFQPIVALPSRTIAGFEALVRWEHPRRGLLAPAEFIPVAEESPLIVALGNWVLEQACCYAQAWSESRDDFYISVNVAARQLRAPAFADALATTLATTGLAPERLMLELTETTLVDDQARTALTEDIAPFGVRIALDDFGTGYSSLSYLQQLPVDVVKVDRAFVSHLDDDGVKTIVTSVAAISSAMGFLSIAEGVETDEVADQIAALDYGYAQGFLYSRPVWPHEIPPLLDDQRRALIELG